MNIRAYMAALDVWDLDHAAKHALVMICGRADRNSGAVTVPIERIASDMKVSRKTAERALSRLVETGYLNVDKSCGKPNTWRIDLGHLRLPPKTPGVLPPKTPGSPTKESLEKNKGGHPRRCQCGGSGWLPVDGGGPLTAVRCPGETK